MYLLPARKATPLLTEMVGSTVRVFSYGGGVQSNAVLVLAAQGKVNYDVFVFADVGDDSENPATIEYVNTVAKPFAKKHGIQIVTVQKTTYGKPETLMGYIHRTKKSVPIPARMSNGAPGNRSCTNDFKIRVVDKWVKSNGYDNAIIGLGLSIDEYHRVRDERWHDKHGKRKIGYWKKRHHPLVDLRLSRLDCRKIITGAGLPMPPKSSCFFCPFKRRSEWIEMKRHDPDLFLKAVELEHHINSKRDAIGRDTVYLHASCTPLENAVASQPMLFPDDEMDMCESGYCHT